MAAARRTRISTRGKAGSPLEAEHSSVNRFIISPFRPRGSLDLLLRANVMADDFAARAWRDWLRKRSIENATRLELRLLTPLARRLGTLDPRSPFRSRLEGLAKSQ